jgi:SAM-dependent methyltransferase
MIDNPARGRFNAWLLDLLDDYMDRKYGAVKGRLFRDLPPTVVELGPGSGANFRYYPRGTRVIAIEPNARMHERLERAATRHGLELDLHGTGGETIDLPSQSADVVCSTLVLCSVSNRAAVLGEIRRILRPGGRFVAIEHVPAPPRSAVATLQRIVRRPWRWVFEGCELCNDTRSLLGSAGFQRVEIEPLKVKTLFAPIRYQIVAVCTA